MTYGLITLAVSGTGTGTGAETWMNGLYALCRIFHTVSEQDRGQHLLSPIVLVPVPVPVLVPDTTSVILHLPRNKRWLEIHCCWPTVLCLLDWTAGNSGHHSWHPTQQYREVPRLQPSSPRWIASAQMKWVYFWRLLSQTFSEFFVRNRITLIKCVYSPVSLHSWGLLNTLHLASLLWQPIRRQGSHQI